MIAHGFIRLAAAVPSVRVADCDYNVRAHLDLIAQAEIEAVDVLVFPELSLTAYTCADLFQQISLQRSALAALERIIAESRSRFSGLLVVGCPLVAADQLFNCAVVVCRGEALGVVPKSFIPNYKEFYEGRWFAPASTAATRQILLSGREVPFGTDILFPASDEPDLTVGVEICEDVWVPVPPSSLQALAGATVLVNLSASNEVIGKSAYRRQLVVNQSGRCFAAYVYAGCGPGESSTDVVFGGHCLIAENGVLLAESSRFRRDGGLLVVDSDLDHLRVNRLHTNSFGAAQMVLGQRPEYRRGTFILSPPQPLAALGRTGDRGLRQAIEAHPFVPSARVELRERCEEIFNTQVGGLAQRLAHIGKPPVIIGISGGLDSTLALLVASKTFDALGSPRERIRAFTLPGFGTTNRTLENARRLMHHLGVTAHEIDIRPVCLEEMKALGYRPFGVNLEGMSVEQLTARLEQLTRTACHDLVFENVQARARTSLLMNQGFVIGTSDLSELALGWCTYNGDHMSMYNPNVSIPKTLVKFLVRWAAENEFEGETRRTLLDIVDTLISPELLPAGKNGDAVQATEQIIGPYELHDFFLFHFLRYGTPPEKILYLAEHARFERTYSSGELGRWLRVFLERFFANQFKRSCLADGPKVGSVSLSPRGDWRMPSDAQAALWLQWAADGVESDDAVPEKRGKPGETHVESPAR